MTRGDNNACNLNSSQTTNEKSIRQHSRHLFIPFFDTLFPLYVHSHHGLSKIVHTPKLYTHPRYSLLISYVLAQARPTMIYIHQFNLDGNRTNTQCKQCLIERNDGMSSQLYPRQHIPVFPRCFLSMAAHSTKHFTYITGIRMQLTALFQSISQLIQLIFEAIFLPSMCGQED